jgi:hypothetical protein
LTAQTAYLRHCGIAALRHCGIATLRHSVHQHSKLQLKKRLTRHQMMIFVTQTEPGLISFYRTMFFVDAITLIGWHFFA